jgi:exportin-5
LGAIELTHFFRFMVDIVQHRSLIVSIPVLHQWVKILKSQHTGNLDAVWSVIGPLLDTAGQRILRYELLPDDSDEPSIVFLNEDIDTIPERHAFLGNYRRFCYQIVETVTQRKPKEAISHILSQVDISLDQIEAETPQFDPATYRKSSGSLLRMDAHLTVVEAALKGYSKLVLDHGNEPPKDEKERNFLDSQIESWASSLLTKRKYEDPLMKQRIIKLAVECSARALERNQAFALKVLEHILLTQTADQPQHPAYSEAARELQVYATSELRRLASRHADYFATFYDQLEAKIRQVLSSTTFDEKAEAEMYGTLLIVLQRAANVDSATRDRQLETLVESLLRGWQSEHVNRSMSSFENFCLHLGIDRVGMYLQLKRASGVLDWSAIQLDAAGSSIQSDMNDFVSQVPLRMTKTAIGVMTEKLAEDSQPYLVAVHTWSSRIPMLLPKVLRLVEFAHRLHDVDSWTNLPPEMRPIMGRVLQDRFWQAGISTGSRDEFYSRVTTTKASLEGFASFVRGKIRLIREACYQILHSMSRLGDHFYSYSELPGPLAQSLISSAAHLSSHQFSVLLQMMRSMVDDCPVAHRQQFLPPILSTLLGQIDRKITLAWEEIDRRKADNTGEDNLTLEMKEESILRQLTYAAVTFVAVLVDPLREHNQQPSDTHAKHQHQTRRQSPPQTPSETLRAFILSNPTILEPLLLFSTHMLTTRDSRSTSTITRVLRTIVPNFAALCPSSADTPTTTVIREYIATSILKAALTSLNDGYFADLQKELASLIATIWVAYGCVTHFPAAHGQNPDGTTGAVVTPAYDRPPLSETPKDIILSLPGMTTQRVDAVAAALTATGGAGGHMRQQRALVLDLLDDLRGVRISELGKITSHRGAEKSTLQERYMRVQGQGAGEGQEGMEGVEGKVGVDVEDGPDLGGVGELLG